MKTCADCGEDKPLSRYNKKSGRDGQLHSYCKDCMNRRRREDHATEKGRKLKRIRRLKHRYGITPEEYASLLLKQNGVCAICRKPETKIRGGTVVQLSVDHDHVTGAIRGLLCMACNLMIGNALDNPATLIAGAAYLEH